MKKFIKKHLQESNEGFSLVELIIVIAIMAILIGVVALQVIPYMEKSRESKDLSQLDAAYRAFETAVADTQTTGDVFVAYTGTGDDLQTTMYQNLGLTGAELEAKLASKNCAGKTIYLYKSGTTLSVYVGTAVGTASGYTPVKGDYNQKNMESSNKESAPAPTS